MRLMIRSILATVLLWGGLYRTVQGRTMCMAAQQEPSEGAQGVGDARQEGAHAASLAAIVHQMVEDQLREMHDEADEAVRRHHDTER